MFNYLPMRHDHALSDLNVKFTEYKLCLFPVKRSVLLLLISKSTKPVVWNLDGVEAEHIIHCSGRVKLMLCIEAIALPSITAQAVADALIEKGKQRERFVGYTVT